VRDRSACAPVCCSGLLKMSPHRLLPHWKHWLPLWPGRCTLRATGATLVPGAAADAARCRASSFERTAAFVVPRQWRHSLGRCRLLAPARCASRTASCASSARLRPSRQAGTAPGGGPTDGMTRNSHAINHDKPLRNCCTASSRWVAQIKHADVARGRPVSRAHTSAKAQVRGLGNPTSSAEDNPRLTARSLHA
jgi:hypothetical protein